MLDLVEAPPHHHRVRQLPAAGRAADQPAQRAGLRAATGETVPPGHQRSARSWRQSGAGGGPARQGFQPVAPAHHGSVSREQRAIVEEELKSGRLPAVVATSSLELGIDMGAVDLVVQVESPPTVATGLQRVGRAGHQVGAVSRGVIFPKYRGDLVQCAVVAERMQAGAIESTPLPAQPARRARPADRGHGGRAARARSTRWPPWCAGRRRSPRCPTPRCTPCSTCSPGRYPSDAFAELRPRLTWDRVTDTLTARAGAQRLAVTSGGTIPDRGLFGVFLVGGEGTGGRRVGELDEEMVYESRVGDVFLLGSSSWRIEDITHDRVLVTPAPGQPGKMPFWHGDAPGRPLELGRALGAFLREVGSATPEAGLERAAGGRAGRVGRGEPARLPRRAEGRRPATCPTTARCWSSGSATSWATGGWSSTPPSARRSTRRGRWCSRPGCASATAWTSPRCTPTTASCCGCPTPPASRRRPTWPSSTPTTSSAR